ncbi:MAG: zinc ribbon domain-containing protein [Chitinivibrionales bacterium]|nr:zinc ribbon domain-containing protein [Chitinivibrionales bacterium]
MPIYEFYCPKCNTLFNFLSRTVNTEKIPSCPKSKTHTLSRKVSRFAAIKGGKSSSDEGGDDSMENMSFDESKMENAMASLASEAEKINEDDPRQAALLMRKFGDRAGMRFNDTIEEALGRMEAGEDPQSLEQELGDALEGEDPFVMQARKGNSGMRPPRKDDTLYEM